MSFRIEVTWTCNGCQRTELVTSRGDHYDLPSIPEGWLDAGDEDYCPQCWAQCTYCDDEIMRGDPRIEAHGEIFCCEDCKLNYEADNEIESEEPESCEGKCPTCGHAREGQW